MTTKRCLPTTPSLTMTPDDDEEVPTDDPVAAGEFQDGSLEHPVDLTVEDEDVTKSGFVLKFLGTEIFRIQ